MIEIPESQTLARQLSETLAGRTVTDVFTATHPHRFTWYAGDPLDYPHRLTGRKLLSAAGHGPFVDLLFDEDTHLALSDGVNLRLYGAEADVPKRYQLLLTFDDGRFLVCTVAMYGGILAFQGDSDNPYYLSARSKPSPLDAAFDAAYFRGLLDGVKGTLSAKSFLATEQRIPGLGNGVLQDVLFRAGIHPRRKISTLGPDDADRLYQAVKAVTAEMTARGGRDTEKDLFGRNGGYVVRLSRSTCAEPCPLCGGPILREAYLGGTVYYCPVCQPLE